MSTNCTHTTTTNRSECIAKTDRQTETERDRETKETDRDRQTDRRTETETERERGERERDRDTERDGDRDRETETEWDRERNIETETEKDARFLKHSLSKEVTVLNNLAYTQRAPAGLNRHAKDVSSLLGWERHPWPSPLACERQSC